MFAPVTEVRAPYISCAKSIDLEWVLMVAMEAEAVTFILWRLVT
jgi:hypothetical protein